MQSIKLLLTFIVFNTQASQFDTDRAKVLQLHQLKNKGTASFITVGADSSCDYQIGSQSLQDAVNSGPAEIRLATNTSYSYISITNTSITIVGGYDTCTDANNNTMGSNKSAIQGTTTGNGNVTVTVLNSDIVFKNLKLELGTNGLRAENGGAIFTIENVEFSNNDSTTNGFWGGGVSLKNVLNPILKDVIIANNTAISGGGLSCNGEKVLIVGESSIFNNMAMSSSANGGGIYASSSCDVTYIGGNNLTSQSGIHNNSASLRGGGIYLTQSSSAYLSGSTFTYQNINYGNNSAKLLIHNNSTTFANPTNQGHGGGAIHVANSTLNLYNISLLNNHTEGHGGAVYIVNGHMQVRKPLFNCWINDVCNDISYNSSKGNGGAFYIRGSTNLPNSSRYIYSSIISHNRAKMGTAVFLNESKLYLFSSLIYENGDFGNGLYTDLNVLHIYASKIYIYQSTIVNNDSVNYAINLQSIIPTPTALATVKNSFIYNPALLGYYYSSTLPTNMSPTCLMVDDTNNSSIGSVYAIGSISFNDAFIDAANGDYHLNDNSIGLDKCVPLNLTNIDLRDLDNNSYDYDFPVVPNIGLADIGADENISTDIIYIDNFEVN